MLKYIETRVTFSEVPDEVTLCINLTNCPHNCEGCHSPYLRENTGTKLTVKELQKLVSSVEGITCVAFMGGDNDPYSIDKMCNTIHKRTNLKTCWYSGSDIISEYININNFDYIKIGPYVKSLGGLNSIITNQKFYKVEHGSNNSYQLKDITYRFSEAKEKKPKKSFFKRLFKFLK